VYRFLPTHRTIALDDLPAHLGLRKSRVCRLPHPPIVAPPRRLGKADPVRQTPERSAFQPRLSGLYGADWWPTAAFSCRLSGFLDGDSPKKDNLLVFDGGLAMPRGVERPTFYLEPPR
jgi:hypothetical protein